MKSLGVFLLGIMMFLGGMGVLSPFGGMILTTIGGMMAIYGFGRIYREMTGID